MIDLARLEAAVENSCRIQDEIDRALSVECGAHDSPGAEGAAAIDELRAALAKVKEKNEQGNVDTAMEAAPTN